MFYTIAYKTGYLQFSTIDGKESVYAQYWADGTFHAEKANSVSHAKRLITIRSN